MRNSPIAPLRAIDGDFVVFLIGAFPDKFHLVRSFLDLGGRRGMKHMLDYLMERPDKGLLGYQMGWPAIVQYGSGPRQAAQSASPTDPGRVAAPLS